MTFGRESSEEVSRQILDRFVEAGGNFIDTADGTRVAIAEEQGWGESWSAYNNEHTWHVLDALFAVAEEISKSPAHVALNWLLRRPGVTAPIIGARTLEQLEANLGAVSWLLDERALERLNRASAIQTPYPYEHIERAQARR
jgi:aryl-alcohol dehydrogenase-like predicted oxidoreductase